MQEIISGKFYNIWENDQFNLELTGQWYPLSSGKYICPDMQGYIYLFSGVNNGGNYIGSSERKKRFSYHISSFRADDHKNQYMQRFYNKYNSMENPAFQFQVIQIIPPELTKFRDEIENSYIRHFDTFHNGFNLMEFSSAGIPRKVKSEITLRRENGEIITGTRKFFYENYLLDSSSIASLLNGSLKTSRGFCLVDTLIEKFTLKSPDGQIITDTFKNLIKNFNLDRAGIRRVIDKVYLQYKGWSLIDTPEPVLLANQFSNQKQKIIFDYLNSRHLTLRKISKKYNLTVNRLNYLLDEWKVRLPKGERGGSILNPYKDKIIEYIKQGLTSKEICEIYKISYTQFNNFLRYNKIKKIRYGQ